MVVLAFLVLALAPQLIATHDPNAQDTANSLWCSPLSYAASSRAKCAASTLCTRAGRTVIAWSSDAKPSMPRPVTISVISVRGVAMTVRYDRGANITGTPDDSGWSGSANIDASYGTEGAGPADGGWSAGRGASRFLTCGLHTVSARP